MSRYTLLYDGACQLCTSQVQIVANLDTAGSIELLDMTTQEARVRFPHITPQAAQREIHLAHPDGTTLYRGVEAIRQTLLLLPGLRVVGGLLSLPGAATLAKPVYAWVARHRYLLGGRIEACDDGACSTEIR